MFETILVAVCVALVLAAAGLYRELGRERHQKDEYKQLFELGDGEYKKAQAKVQELLGTSTYNHVIMDRASIALDAANTRVVEQNTLIKALDEKLRFQEVQYNKLLGQKKSSEVRTGKIAEQVAPFLQDYPLSPETARFIGEPIDFIHFDDDAVTFVEVKSGRSQLSKKQRLIRDMIKEGKVNFVLYRIEGDTDDDDGGPEDKGGGGNGTS